MFLNQNQTLGNDTSSGSNRIDWNAIINQGFAIGSQAINAYSGRTTGTQIGYNASNRSIFAIQQTPNYDDRFPGVGFANAALNPAVQYGAGGPGAVGLDDAATSITTYIARNPLLVGGIALGAFLLFREPPSRRR